MEEYEKKIHELRFQNITEALGRKEMAKEQVCTNLKMSSNVSQSFFFLLLQKRDVRIITRKD